MNRTELNSFFKQKLEDFSAIDARIRELRKKLSQANTMEDESLMQINMGICVFSVNKERAVQILSEAIEIEQNYHRIMQYRFDKAVGALMGELDG